MSLPSQLYSWKDANANPIRYYTDNTAIYVGMPLYNNQGTDTGRTIGFIQNNTFDVACTLTINPTPSDATVTLTSSGYTQSGNSITVRTGTNVNYTVSKSGYTSQSGTVAVTNNQSLSITLVSFRTLTINPIPSNSTVTLTASGYTQSGNSITVPTGTSVSYSVSNTSEGYTTRTGSITVNSTQTTSIRLAKGLTYIGRFNGGVQSIQTQSLLYDKYNYVRIDYAGAAGQQAYARNTGGTISSQGTVGRGAIKRVTASFSSDVTIQMVVGAQPGASLDGCGVGGWGYHSGGSAQYVENPDGFVGKLCSGGGGGSTAVALDQIYEACGGGGVGLNMQFYNMYHILSGAGGGATGGANSSSDTTSQVVNGKDATDSNTTGYNTGNGYVEIWASSVI